MTGSAPSPRRSRARNSASSVHADASGGSIAARSACKPLRAACPVSAPASGTRSSSSPDLTSSAATRPRPAPGTSASATRCLGMPWLRSARKRSGYSGHVSTGASAGALHAGAGSLPRDRQVHSRWQAGRARLAARQSSTGVWGRLAKQRLRTSLRLELEELFVGAVLMGTPGTSCPQGVHALLRPAVDTRVYVSEQSTKRTLLRRRAPL